MTGPGTQARTAQDGRHGRVRIIWNSSAGSKGGNKGFEAAVTAIEMVDLLRQLPASRQHAGGRNGVESPQAGSLVPALTHALAEEGIAPPVTPSP